ncbi:MAG: hypothetical protein IPJ84_15070 [Bdellovibrionales bacterium]|nr:hypothetical protein [Bdellovibrionales bacterium]
MKLSLPAAIKTVLPENTYSIEGLLISETDHNTLELGSVRITSPTKVCGIRLHAGTQIVFDDMDRDGSFSIRPTEPVKINEKEYPAFRDGETFYEVFNGTQCKYKLLVAKPGEQLK